jgi:hypothetical protein
VPHIPVVYQFFGPVQTPLVQSPGPTWTFPGIALSPSTKAFPFKLGTCFARAARWVHIWTPNLCANQARLVYFDDGPTNIIEAALLPQSDRREPTVLAVDVLALFNTLTMQSVSKHLGVQVRGNGRTAFQLFESRLEVLYGV